MLSTASTRGVLATKRAPCGAAAPCTSGQTTLRRGTRVALAPHPMLSRQVSSLQSAVAMVPEQQDHLMEPSDDEPEVLPQRAQGRPFSTSSMEDDGHKWVAGELSHALIGLERRTPRVRVVTTRLAHYEGGLFDDVKGGSRCERLNLDLEWRAEAKEAEGQPLVGSARVSMDVDQHECCDRVRVEQVVVHAADGSDPHVSERVLRDVQFAVQSLDSAIMESLNTFLWQVEANNPCKV